MKQPTKKPETLEQKTLRLRALRLAAEARHPPPPAREDRYPAYGLADELQFGKHAGHTVEDVILADPSWLRWALENIHTFSVTEEVEEELYLQPRERDC